MIELLFDFEDGVGEWGFKSLRHTVLIEGSLEVKLPTTWRDGKAEVGRVGEEKRRREKIREEKE